MCLISLKEQGFPPFFHFHVFLVAKVVGLFSTFEEKGFSFFPADGLVHFHVLLVAEAASRGDQLGAPLHFNQELSEGEEEEGSWLFQIFLNSS